MDIKVSELRSVINHLLDYVEQETGSTINVERDAYWFVSNDAVYDPYAESPKLTMGQLSDDWQNLKGILDKKDNTVGYALVWASTLLRAVGDQVP